jgi:hypothetical protein
VNDISAEAVERHIAQNPQLLGSTIELLRALAKDGKRLDLRAIVIEGRDEFDEPARTLHVDIDLRAAIDAAMQEKPHA